MKSKLEHFNFKVIIIVVDYNLFNLQAEKNCLENIIVMYGVNTEKSCCVFYNERWF